MLTKHVIIAAAVFTALCLGSAAIIAVSVPRTESVTRAGSAASYTETAQVNTENTPPGDKYVIRAELGQIAVFRAGEIEPLFITDIKPETLRETDRLSFESGIYLNSYEDLIRLLEDFSN